MGRHRRLDHDRVLARLVAGDPQREIAAEQGTTQPAVALIAARAGVPLRKVGRYTDEVLLAHLRAAARELGRPPLAKEFRARPGAPRTTAYLRRWGTWWAALEAAELERAGRPRRLR